MVVLNTKISKKGIIRMKKKTRKFKMKVVIKRTKQKNASKIIEELTDIKFRRYSGVTKKIFYLMCSIMVEFRSKKNLGAPFGLDVQEEVLMFLEYLRNYSSMEKLAIEYGITIATVHRVIHKLKDVLSADGRISVLPSNEIIFENKSDDFLEEKIIDVTEIAILRQEGRNSKYYSGKSKKEAYKIQVVINSKRKILNAKGFPGSVHDFKCFQESDIKLSKKSRIVADSAYKGIEKTFPNAYIPEKKSKLNPLTPEQKKYNRLQSKKRTPVEHVIKRLKVFNIFGTRFRNKLSSCIQLVGIISGICNLMYQ